jgi:hypothetical protein
VRAIREAVQECRHARPDLVERLRQRILVRCLLAEIPAERVLSALGGPPVKDAALCRLVARAGEKAGDVFRRLAEADPRPGGPAPGKR